MFCYTCIVIPEINNVHPFQIPIQCRDVMIHDKVNFLISKSMLVSRGLSGRYNSYL